MNDSLARYSQVVVWGGGHNKDSFRHIQSAFFRTAQKMGMRSYWVADDPNNRSLLTPGSLVIVPDMWAQHIGAAMPQVDYVGHNLDGDNHPLCKTVDPERLLRLQVFTNDATGEEWGPVRRYDREARTLFEPWGCSLLAEEFLDPVFNPQARDTVYVGAIWSDSYQGRELGNEVMVAELKLVLVDHGLKFKHLTQVPEQEMIDATRSARFAPAFAGAWQVEKNYVPCRCLKTPSFGAVCVTNVPVVRALFDGCHVAGESLTELVDAVLSLRRSDYLEMVSAQQKVAARYSYRESLESIGRALEAGRV